MDLAEWYKLANSIIGGVSFVALAWLVGSRKIRIAYEADREVLTYKSLWEAEKEARAKLEHQNDQLVLDLRQSSETLNGTAKALQNANAMLQNVLDRRRLGPGQGIEG